MKKLFLFFIAIILSSICFAQVSNVEVRKQNISYFDAIILGLVEGITEFLPVSSTGHLILANEFLGLNEDTILKDKNSLSIQNESGEKFTLKNAADAYAIMIQFGAILAVALIYRNDLMKMLLGFVGKDKYGRKLFINIIVAFIPAVILGLLLGDLIESYLFGVIPVIIALAVGAFLMLLTQKIYDGNVIKHKNFSKLEDVTIRQSLLIGILQCLAMWPGTSRSMMTILGGYFVGLKPADSAKFSFLLGLITLGAASIYKTFKDGEAILQNISTLPLLLGLFVAFLSSALSVKWLVGFLNKRGLIPFAWYRILIATILSVMLFLNYI